MAITQIGSITTYILIKGYYQCPTHVHIDIRRMSVYILVTDKYPYIPIE